MKHLYFIFSLIFAVGFMGCKDDDEPGTTKKKFDPNASIKVTGQKKLQQRSAEPGTMSYEDSIKFIVKYARKWGYNSNGYPDWIGGTAENESVIGARDTINNKIIWWGEQVVTIKDITPEKDTIFRLGAFITHLSDLVLLMAMKEDGTPYIPDPSWPDFEIFPQDMPCDTVGYIPNSVVLKARELITEAFDKGDFERCYELFDSAYVFVPINGEKYRELQTRGEN